MNKYFDCDNIGELKEYIGRKIEKSEVDYCIMIKQPVIIKSFTDGFNIERNLKIECPASSGEFFSQVENGEELNDKDQKVY